MNRSSRCAHVLFTLAGILAWTAAPLAATPPGATLYTDEEFRGRSESFDGDDPRLSDNLIGDDTVHSVRVGPGCEVTLYEHDYYGGRSVTLTEDASTLHHTAVGEHAASSLRVSCFSEPEHGEGGGVVTLYSDEEFRGRSESFDGDDPRLSNNQIGDDTAHSVRVDPGCEVTLYEHDYYGGRSVTLTEDALTLHHTAVGEHAASSLRVNCFSEPEHGEPEHGEPGDGEPAHGEPADDEPVRGVTLYRDSNFRGASETFYSDQRNMGQTSLGNDEASSVRVDRGCEVVLYKHAYFRGRSIVLVGDLKALRGTAVGNDSVSSVRVDCGPPRY